MRKKALPTLKDVARLAGVGTTTASRVINGGHRVKPDTLVRVQRVIEKLGFQPNHAARILKGESTKTIGIIVPSISDPFFSTFASAAQQVARSHGYVAILGASDGDRQTEKSQIEVLARHRVDGILISAAFPGNAQLVASLEALRKPVVAFDRPIKNSDFPYIIVDNQKGAREAVEHLIGHGHRRIACMRAEPDLFTIRQRVQGYRDVMKRHGLPIVISGEELSLEVVRRELEEMMDCKTPPTALFSTKNLTTIYIFQALQAMGYSIPDDIALIGFDDFDSAPLMSPSITVVRQPVLEIGRCAAWTLFDRIEKLSTSRNGRTVLATELHIRESCGCTSGR